MSAFKDILSGCREPSDFMFMSRGWNPLVAYKHNHKTSPQKIKAVVFNSPQVQAVINEIAAEDNTNKEQLHKTAKNILNEIGYSKNMGVVRWFGMLLLKILRRNYAGLLVNEATILKVKSQMGTNPVIFAPSHRSYGDFILMAYICFHYDIEIPAVAAGMDFHSMWLMGRLLRDCGAFFMRRSFGKDKLYWTIFTEYVQTVIVKGDEAVEFFIEGTRSRTGKSLVPKIGFLSMALQPFFDGRVPDITIVPISICYDRTLEELLFAYELLGVTKPKESTSGLVKALKMLDEQYGKIYIEFGEPISARSLCVSNGHVDPRPWHSSLSIMPNVPNEIETLLIQELAYYIVNAQRLSTVLTPFNVLAMALAGSLLWEEDGPITMGRATREVSWLISVLEALGALVDNEATRNLEEVLKDTLRIHKSLVVLTASDTLHLAKVHSSTQEISPARLKGHALSQDVMQFAIPLVMLQHYVNPCLYFIIGPAMITVAMRSMHTEEVSRDELFRKYHFIRLLLSHEFVLNGAWELKEFEESLKQLDLLNILETSSSGNLVLGNHRKLQAIFCNLLRPFVEGYLAFCHVVWKHASSACTEIVLLQETQKQLEELLVAGRIGHPYSLSLDMLSAALQSLVSLQAVCKDKSNGIVKYQRTESVLREVINELESINTFSQVRNNFANFSTDQLRAKL